MLTEEKQCPQCGGPMDLRLGIYECRQCGHEVERPPPESAAVGPSHGPGFRREAWHRAAPGRSAQIPPPPAPGTVYSPGQSPFADLGASVSGHDPYPTLHREKIVLFSIHAAIWLLLFITCIIAFSMLGATVPGMFPSAALIFVILAIEAVIYLGFYWLVLFLPQLWVKYTCGGCFLVAAVLSIPGCLNLMSTTGGFDPFLDLVMMLVVILQFLLNFWLLWILWRDIQVLQGRV